MAQLIKLQNYISRYENDLFHYPARYVRLKKQEWGRFQENWTHHKAASFVETVQLKDEWMVEAEKERTGFFRSFFSKKEPLLSKEEGVQKEEDATLFSINEIESAYLHTEEDAKKLFVEKMYYFQVKWASSTLLHKSPLDHKYYVDERLKFLLQRLPDTFLVLYEPILRFQKATVELDVVIITPIAVWCLTFLEEQDEAVFAGTEERFWTKRYGDAQSKLLSPIVSLARTETLVKKLLRDEQIDLPIRKAILSRNGYIDYPSAPTGMDYIDKRAFDTWFHYMRKMSSPLKTIQLKAAKALLDQADTISIRRPEWEEEELQ
ncbi:nuclease-related domain-containing protein [Domibacillus mangrovi]|uniref:NERD domain-containing protein n=1 Tax=Domibacillus mangrovi TaxID=1714354 RepID=A0A1Q5P1Z0_9BACI|nr:nuclease-related domain-containing protein [Domibacillus mangrovi]OKL36201.1 hypothetical protein BLL40_11365 [Domibacillus mangrovi]